MLDPEYLLLLTEAAEEIAADLHDTILAEIISRIAVRLARKEDFLLTATDKWQIETLQEAGLLKKDIEEEIAKKSGLELEEIKKAFEDAGIRSTVYDSDVYEAAGITSRALDESPYMIRLLQRGYEATAGNWLNYTRSLADSGQKLFIRECDKAYNLVTTGTMSYTDAFMRAVDTVSENGAYVTYPSGARTTVEVAALRALRTGVSQTTSQITAVRAAEMKMNCFLVSAHNGARPEHEAWQGKVYWIDWEELKRRGIIPADMDADIEVPENLKEKYGEFCKETGIGTVSGLCGINCRHSYGPFIDGLSKNPYENMDFSESAEMYEKTQRQRAMERAIRKTKRKLSAVKTALQNVEDPETAAKLQMKADAEEKKLTEEIKSYNDYCAKEGLRPLEERLKTSENSFTTQKENDTVIKISGGLNPTGGRAEKHAELYYEEVRHRTTDIEKIAKSSGFSKEKIGRIKNFIFFEEHELDGRYGRFEPSYMMAESWRRLSEGNPENHDITLLKHEEYEMSLMNQGMTQREAHILASSMYNYQMEAENYYDRIKKYREER